MARQHALRFQCTIPASMTRTPQQVLQKTIQEAANTIRRMVPYATDFDVSPIYRERKTRKLGTVWDLLVVCQFNHRGPLPPNVLQLKLWWDIRRKQLVLN